MLVAQKARFPPAEKAAFLRAARLERYQPAIGAFGFCQERRLTLAARFGVSASEALQSHRCTTATFRERPLRRRI